MSTLDSARTVCDAKALDWALFILTIISTSVTWWLFPLPTLFTRGLSAYIHDVSWECLRLLIPSLVAYKSVLQDRQHWQMSYYSGVAKPSTRFQDVKAFVKDSFIVVSTVLAIYRLCKGGKADKNLSGLNDTLWNYPSLPVAILGFAISIFARTQVKKWIIYASTLFVVAIIGATMSVIIGLTYGHNIYVASLVLLIYMAVPLWAISRQFILMSALLSTMARIGGPVIGAVSPQAYFPFCALRGWKFAGPMLGIGIVCAILAFHATKLQPRIEPLEVPTDEEMATK